MYYIYDMLVCTSKSVFCFQVYKLEAYTELKCWLQLDLTGAMPDRGLRKTRVYTTFTAQQIKYKAFPHFIDLPIFKAFLELSCLQQTNSILQASGGISTSTSRAQAGYKF